MHRSGSWSLPWRRRCRDSSRRGASSLDERAPASSAPAGRADPHPGSSLRDGRPLRRRFHRLSESAQLREVSDSLLSKHLAVLEEAGYVSVQKGFEGKRARTWLSLTDTGRKAYGNYIAALRSITDADS